MQQLNYGQPVNPRNPIMETLQYYDMYGKLKDQNDARLANRQNAEMAQLAAQQAAQRQAELGSALDAVHKNPTRENYMTLSNLYAVQDPEKAKAFRENWNIMDEGTKQTMFKDSVNFLYQIESDPELAAKDLEERALAEEKSNRPEEAKKTRSMISMLKTGPKGVQSVKDSVVMLIGGIPELGKPAIDGFVNYSEEQRAKNLAELATGGKISDPKDIEAAENLLRKEYDSKQSVFKQIGNFYNVITNADKNSIGDIALITTYMKILDPNSVVREGEFLQASEAGGIPSTIVAAYNKALGTGKIDDKVRDDIYSQSKKIYDTTKAQNELDRGFYTDIAKRRGLNVENIIYNASDSTSKPAGTTPTAGISLRDFIKKEWPGETTDIDNLTDVELRAKYKKTTARFDAGTGTPPAAQNTTEVNF